MAVALARAKQNGLAIFLTFGLESTVLNSTAGQIFIFINPKFPLPQPFNIVKDSTSLTVINLMGMDLEKVSAVNLR